MFTCSFIIDVLISFWNNKREQSTSLYRTIQDEGGK